MNSSGLEPAYEAARMWSLRPVSHPPAGWAQILCGGMFFWMREWPARLRNSPLLLLVATMIAEVCQ